MSTLFTAAALELLRDQLLPFGATWRASTGRDLATVRDGLDFLAVMKNREDFWATLAAASAEPSHAVELRTLRAALPPAPLGGDESVEGRLSSLGLASEEVTGLLAAVARPEGVGDAIRDAFSAGSPQEVARALEQILDTSAEVIATDRHLRRISGSQGASRVLGSLLGIALFLVGASYAPEARASDSNAPATQRSAEKSTSSPSTKAEKTAPTHKPHTRPPRAGYRYKGVSPRRRA
jgi:hypothetical protein